MIKFNPGYKSKQNGYSAFVPSEINREWSLTDAHLQKKLSLADRYLGRLDAFSDMVNIDLYVHLHVTKEATLSSKIEGTQTNIREALMGREDISNERRDDWEEVKNYVAAINEAKLNLKQFPFSTRLIKMTHKTLMQGVRGMRKEPGEFRRSQNWWGGTNPQNAAFVPPPPHEIPRLMGDLEKLANDEYNPLPELLRIALIHYQFETIHPFQDGNGRIGRLMVPLYLLSQGIIRQPVLYLSAYLERHRLLYYDKLTYVRERGDLLGWYLFFLDGIIETAKDGVMTFQRIIALEKALPKRLGTLGSRAAKAQLILQELFRNPIIDAASVQRVIGSTHRTAYRLLADLEDLNILKQIPSAGRARLYAFQDYLDLFS